MKKILFVIGFTFIIMRVSAQCPPNLDAEDATLFANWSIYTGSCSAGAIGTQTATTYSPTTPVAPSVVLGIPRDTITSGGTDLYGGFPRVCNLPGASQHSIQVGNDQTGSEADMLRYYYRVPQAFKYYFAQFYYAFVLDNGGGHPVEQQPRFTISVYDSATNNLIGCNYFQLAMNPNCPTCGGLTQSSYLSTVYYKAWTPGTIELKNQNGRTVYFQFETTDCSNGGHFGYGYFDFVTCSQSVVLQTGCYNPGGNIATGDTLIGPKGLAQLKWYNKSLTTVIDSTHDTLTIAPALLVNDTFNVVLVPYSGFGCKDTIPIYFKPPQPPVSAFIYPTTYCSTSYLQFADSSYITTLGDYVDWWAWNFGDIPSSIGPNNLNTDSTQNPIHTYNSMGTYTISLIVKTRNGCKSDTTYHNVVINKTPPPIHFGFSRNNICAPRDSIAISFVGLTFPGFKYHWTVPTGCFITSGSDSSSAPITIKAKTSGMYTVGFEIIPPSGDTSCWEHKDTTFNVKGVYPSVFESGNDSICLHQNTVITTSGKPVICGPASSVCANPSTFTAGINNAGTTYSTPFYAYEPKEKSQILILANELTSQGFQGGPISEIALNVTQKNSSSNSCTNSQFEGLTISMACVPYNSFKYSTSYDSLDLNTPLTTVYSATSFNTVAGLNSFHFQTPYNWDGVSNLLIQICYDAGSCSSSPDYVAATTFNSIATTYGAPAGSTFFAYAYAYSNATPCDPFFPYSPSNTGYLGYIYGSYYANRPDVLIKGCSGNIPNPTTFNWTSTPAGYTSSQQNITVSPSVTTTYHVTADNNGCQTKDSFKVNVLTVNTVSAGNDTLICAGSHIVLNGSATGPIPLTPVPCAVNTTGGCTGVPLVSSVLGSGNDVSATYSPFNNNYNNGKVAMRYSAASLQATLGTGPKILTSLQFNVTAHQSFYNYSGLEVKMSCINSNTPYWTNNSNFPGGVIVYGPSSYNISAGNGWKTITLTNPYNWDGQSDLIIEMCFSSLLFSNIDIVQKTNTVNNCVLYAGNASTPAGCSIPTGTTSTLLPNIKFGYCNFPINANAYNYLWTAVPATPNPFISRRDTATPIVAPFANTKFYVTLLGTSFCPVSDTVLVTAVTAYQTLHNAHDTVCKWSNVTLFDSSANAGQLITNWHWQSLHGNTLSCSTCAHPVITVVASDTIIVVSSLASGCSRTDTIVIDTFRSPLASFVLNHSHQCSGLKVIATSTSAVNAGGGPVTYTWNFNSPDYFGANTTNNIDTAMYINTSTTPLVKTITLKISQDGCTSQTVGLNDTIHMIPIAHITASQSTFCSGVNINESSTGSTMENAVTASYTWSSNPILTTPANLTGPGPNNFTINLPNDSTASVWVYLQITENGCVSNLDSTMLLVNGIPTARFRATPNPSCSGDTVHFVFNGKLDSLSSTLHILNWTFTNGTPSSYSSIATDKAMSVYFNNGKSVSNNSVILVVTQNTCKSAPYVADVAVNPLPQPIITGPRDICANQIAYLSTLVPYQSYTWKDNYGITTHNDSLAISKDETVNLTIVDYNNCKGSANTQITVHPIPVANAGEDQTIFLGNSAHLDGSMSAGGDAFLWMPDNSLNDAHSMLPIATPAATTAYVLTYFNTQVGCADYDTVIVHVKDCKPLLIPNAFTPFNNDGIDDYFMILNPDDYYKLIHMEIYNRWGQMLFSTNDKNSKGWDGKFQGEEQPIGTYIYNITAECGGGKLMQLKGDVTLLR